MPFKTVEYRSSLGPILAWLVPGSDSTWAIFVHGRAASRAEMLRMLPAYRALGLPCLVICYRNDRCGPRALGGRYQMGFTEWRDLEDAVRFALEHGARRVVPVGCSMGGSIVAEFLRHSALASAAPVAVLDAPALDLERHARRRGQEPTRAAMAHRGRQVDRHGAHRHPVGRAGAGEARGGVQARPS